MIYPTVQWKSGKVSRYPLFKMPKEMMSIVTPEDMGYESDDVSQEKDQFEVMSKPVER
jgi:hypothetical protein